MKILLWKYCIENIELNWKYHIENIILKILRILLWKYHFENTILNWKYHIENIELNWKYHLENTILKILNWTENTILKILNWYDAIRKLLIKFFISKFSECFTWNNFGYIRMFHVEQFRQSGANQIVRNYLC